MWLFGACWSAISIWKERSKNFEDSTKNNRKLWLQSEHPTNGKIDLFVEVRETVATKISTFNYWGYVRPSTEILWLRCYWIITHFWQSFWENTGYLDGHPWQLWCSQEPKIEDLFLRCWRNGERRPFPGPKYCCRYRLSKDDLRERIRIFDGWWPWIEGQLVLPSASRIGVKSKVFWFPGDSHLVR